ncbi:serine beta-lactamase-like protein LACTB, mitochondrial [Anolis carolinensis]|uniref:Beta-lactamase-related domain-containing protein n=1 Tax=Anolis carolinensis TaxID=28377 RepID=H9GI47_ANOCA|nr:PREDICTED: serine beta-lactamase-like protein LACTB, mitochondrial [Anolis carolinensis]|eukprot:XP_016854648.1 PREDICTED: serine beta-lactamase-like protein LACTB, mitochondrial [Anolis carolinensis]
MHNIKFDAIGFRLPLTTGLYRTRKERVSLSSALPRRRCRGASPSNARPSRGPGAWAWRRGAMLRGLAAAGLRKGASFGRRGGGDRKGKGFPRWGLGLGLGLAAAAVSSAAGSDDMEAGWDPQERPRRAAAYSRAQAASRDLLRRVKDEVGAPGIVVGVSVDGKEVWSEGMGFADVENRVPCRPETVLRIASISKPLAMVAAAKLWEEGKLDLDAPVQKYVPEFPEKEYEGEKVTVTTRLLASHLSGIRHYEKDVSKVKEEKEKANQALKAAAKGPAKEKEDKAAEKSKGSDAKGGKKKGEFEHEEYYLKERIEHVMDSLDIFKNDPLFFKPGSQFLYSTHGFTLLSAVVERASGQRFTDYMLQIFRDLDMSATGLDENEPLIYNRGRYYTHNKKGRLVNAPFVDNSYKWAGGGFVSTVGDLLKFGNAMLYSYQLGSVPESLPAGQLPGYLKPGTVAMLWSTESACPKEGRYGLAWFVSEGRQECGFCRRSRHHAFHTGGAVGASSVLLILPEEAHPEEKEGLPVKPPRGVVVSILCNMQSVSLSGTALKIASEFETDKLAQQTGQNGSTD